MRIFLWLIALFAIAIGIAVVLTYNPGNVVFFYPPYRIDLSLNFFLLLSALLFALVYGVIRTIRTTQNMPALVAAYRQQKRSRDANKALRESLKALFEGRFGHAEKAASRATELPDNAGLAALIGARAAHRMRQPERRDAWFSRVKDDKALKAARLMTMTELFVDDHQHEAALEAVKELGLSGTRHIHALQWALKANQQAKNWPEVLRLVKSLDKNRAIHPALSHRLRELAYEDLLSNRSHDVESIRQVWSRIPDIHRKEPFVASRAANAFSARGLHDDARFIVEKALLANWDERLVRAYRASAAEVGSSALLTQIENCEVWLTERPTDAELALTLGSLCLRQKLWGKAQRYLDQALSDASAPAIVQEAHLKLAQLHEALNQTAEAAAHYRQCALATKP